MASITLTFVVYFRIDINGEFRTTLVDEDNKSITEAEGWRILTRDEIKKALEEEN